MEQNKAERLNENVTEKMCSSDGNVVGEMCSPADADTCGDGVLVVLFHRKMLHPPKKVSAPYRVETFLKCK